MHRGRAHASREGACIREGVASSVGACIEGACRVHASGPHLCSNVRVGHAADEAAEEGEAGAVDLVAAYQEDELALQVLHCLGAR